MKAILELVSRYHSYSSSLKKENIDIGFVLKRYFVKAVIRRSSKRRIQIYRDLSSHLRVSSLSETLVTLQRESERLKSSDLTFYEDIARCIENSHSIHEALDSWLPKTESLMIQTSRYVKNEEGNSLVIAIDGAREVCEKTYDLKKTYSNAVMYPIFIVLVAMGLFFAFKIKGVDFLTKVVPYEKWPEASKIRYETIAYFFDHLVFFSFLGASIVTLVYIFVTKGKGSIRNAFNPIPPFSIYQGIISYTFLLSLARLTSSGVTISNAIEQIGHAHSGWARSEILGIESRFKDGKEGMTVSINEYAFDSLLFPLLIRVKIGSYANREDFVENLNYLNAVIMDDVKANAVKGANILSALILIFVMFFLVQIVIIFLETLSSVSPS